MGSTCCAPLQQPNSKQSTGTGGGGGGGSAAAGAVSNQQHFTHHSQLELLNEHDSHQQEIILSARECSFIKRESFNASPTKQETSAYKQSDSRLIFKELEDPDSFVLQYSNRNDSSHIHPQVNNQQNHYVQSILEMRIPSQGDAVQQQQQHLQYPGVPQSQQPSLFSRTVSEIKAMPSLASNSALYNNLMNDNMDTRSSKTRITYVENGPAAQGAAPVLGASGTGVNSFNNVSSNSQQLRSPLDIFSDLPGPPPNLREMQRGSNAQKSKFRE